MESRQKIEQLKAALEATWKTLKGCEEERDTLQTKTQSLEGSTTQKSYPCIDVSTTRVSDNLK